MKYYTTILTLMAILWFGGCDTKVEDEKQEETILKTEQIATKFNAKIVSIDIEDFSYTADFQGYFSDPNQNFVFSLSIEDVLGQKGQIIAKCYDFDSSAMLFLNITPEMFKLIKEKELWDSFLAVVTIDRIYKPFFGLTGNIEDFEIEYVKNFPKDTSNQKISIAGMGMYYQDRDEDYYEAMPTINGNFYVEITDAPLILFGSCKHLESDEL